MMEESPYLRLARYMLPADFTKYFELTNVTEEERGSELLLHLYLDEKEMMPEGYTDLHPNGFYSESCFNDFPVRDHRTVLHVRRRRWKDDDGNSYSKEWSLVADGIRYSQEFAAFLKELLGYIPDYGKIASETISHKG